MRFRYFSIPLLVLVQYLALSHFIILGTSRSSSLSCYGYNKHESETKTLQGNRFCVAVYDVENGYASFGGIKHHLKFNLIWGMSTMLDCQLGIVAYNGETMKVWYCRCYAQMCNYHFSFSEFQRRGYTLAPLH